MNKIRLSAFIFLIFCNAAMAQYGGNSVYEFLNMPVSARVAALGGNVAAIQDGDITLGLANPSLISPQTHNHIGFSFVDYYSDINYGMAQYSRTFDGVGSFMATMQFVDYGSFEYADASGYRDGSTFSAGDYAFNLGWGRALDSNFSIGANAKVIWSNFETYSSFGLAVDVAGSYISNSGWHFSLLGRNIGAQLSGYTDGFEGNLPFNLQLALSKRLEHVPFRFTLIYDHIQKWDLQYEDPANPSGGVDAVTGDPKELEGVAKITDNFMRHLVFGTELYLGKNIILRGGYNYRRRQEMKVEDKLSLVGFSWGVAIRIKMFHLSYSRATYHLTGSPNYFTLTFNLEEFSK